MKAFLKIILILLIAGFLGMLYWSSLLVEKGMQELRRDIESIKKELHTTKSTSAKALPPFEKSQVVRREPDPAFANLLIPDPFYEKTLPELVGKNFAAHGVRREATLGRPDNFHPFNNFAEVARLNSLCSGQLAKSHFGKYELLAPDMAFKIEKRDRVEKPGTFEYWVYLRDDLFWMPLNKKDFPANFPLSSHFLQPHRVTSHDFKFFYDAVKNPYVAESRAASYRKAYSDIEELEIIDDFTFVVKWQGREDPLTHNYKVKYSSLNVTASLQPLASFVYQYFADGKKIVEDDNYRKSSIFAENFSNHFAKNIIVSCGAYYFDGMQEEKLFLKRNPYFYNPLAALVEEMEVTFKDSMDAVWQDFKAGNIDLCLLPPTQESDYLKFIESKNYIEQKNKISSLTYIDSAYFYLGWNEKNPLLEKREVRLALTEAVNRKRIIDQNLNQMGIQITGPFFYASPSYDKNIAAWPYDPSHAAELLEGEGWIDRDGDGIREKEVDGKKQLFQITLTYYVKSMNTKMICEYISTALREIGISCRLHGVDLPDLSRSLDEKSFDAVFMGWGLGAPPEDPESLWHSSGAKEKGSSNAVGFKNPEADQIINELHFEYDKEKRLALYHRFHNIIHHELPYTFLYSPKRQLLYRENVKNVFIPKERQDLIPEAEVMEPDLRVIWLDP